MIHKQEAQHLSGGQKVSRFGNTALVHNFCDTACKHLSLEVDVLFPWRNLKQASYPCASFGLEMMSFILNNPKLR